MTHQISPSRAGWITVEAAGRIRTVTRWPDDMSRAEPVRSFSDTATALGFAIGLARAERRKLDTPEACHPVLLLGVPHG